MESDKFLLPLVVTTATGVGGVSARVSIVKDALNEQAQTFEHAMTELLKPAQEIVPVTDAVKCGLQDVSRSLGRFYVEASSSTHSLGETYLEAGRANFEQTLQFFQDLAGATDPLEALSIQTNYVNNQMKLFSQQVREFQSAFERLFGAPGKLMKERLPRR